MKQLIFTAIGAVLTLAAVPAIGQPVVKADAAILLAEMPAPPATLADAYQAAYANGAARPDAKPYYQTGTQKLERLQLESQNLLFQFYQKYPTGVPPMPQQPTNRVSAKDKSAMDAATSELAQKMMTDKAFAQQFAKMSEAEQHAYIAKLLADKGLKPAHGMPDPNAAAPMPGTDMDWMTPCNEFMQPIFAMTRWEKQTALQQKYSIQHDAASVWVEAEIEKLPTFVFGEYGRDHDPAQVKAVQKQALDKHRSIADAMMKEAATMFAGFRQDAQMRCAPLNDALQKVGYCAAYNFGLNYTLVLQAQAMMFADLQTLLTNEMSIIEQVARWEQEWRNFEQANR